MKTPSKLNKQGFKFRSHKKRYANPNLRLTWIEHCPPRVGEFLKKWVESIKGPYDSLVVASPKLPKNLSRGLQVKRENTIHYVLKRDELRNAEKATRLTCGSLSVRPVVGDPNQLYINTDDNAVYQWTETGWVKIGHSRIVGDLQLIDTEETGRELTSEPSVEMTVEFSFDQDLYDKHQAQVSYLDEIVKDGEVIGFNVVDKPVSE